MVSPLIVTVVSEDGRGTSAPIEIMAARETMQWGGLLPEMAEAALGEVGRQRFSICAHGHKVQLIL
jgi:hypothetical protein